MSGASWLFLFLFKQKTAYEMRISDWSSDVCSSDLFGRSGGWTKHRRHGCRSISRASSDFRRSSALWQGAENHKGLFYLFLLHTNTKPLCKIPQIGRA